MDLELPDNLVKPRMTLVGIDGNAFSVMGHVARGLRRAGNGPDVIAKYQEQAMAGDYNHLLAVSMEFIDETYGEDDEEVME